MNIPSVDVYYVVIFLDAVRYRSVCVRACCIEAELPFSVPIVLLFMES